MALSIEQAQQLSEYRVRFLRNVQQGLKPEDGFSEEELTGALEMLRQSRNASAIAGAAKAKKTKAAKAAATKVDTAGFFGDMDLDADEEEEATPTTSAAN